MLAPMLRPQSLVWTSTPLSESSTPLLEVWPMLAKVEVKPVIPGMVTFIRRSLVVFQ